ncbi:MAG TPA: GTPase HflX [Hyphomicrobiaceae bacterium]|nr:GTPase HflX [Hyphomicrobiaceae bacterium]
MLVPFRRARRAANGEARASSATHSLEDRAQEAAGLARAIALDVRAVHTVNIVHPQPATLLGSGKVAEIAALVTEHGAGLVIVDHALSPTQQRNLEKAWSCKVLDRTGLILEIFGARALTREGRLQVELAHLTYQRSRLVRSWTHLERQRGGFGFLGGPGEAQIETDRRLIDERITAIRKELAGVVKTRGLHRAGRKRVPLPVAAIVGYTNAGKSTLFNRLTGAGVSARDQVFETLDPTMREVKLPSGRRIVLSDTVGFISHLPTALVAAFRATLEEVVEADLVLHVRDISHPETEAQRADVARVLADLGVDTQAADAAVLEVWNKIDSVSAPARAELTRAARRNEPPTVVVSALTGEGTDALLAAMDRHFGRRDEVVTVEIPSSEGRLLSWLHQNAEVLHQSTSDSGSITATLRLDAAARARFDRELKRAGLALPHAGRRMAG